MRAIADDLGRQGEDVDSFVKLHDTYRRRRHEVESTRTLRPAPPLS